MYRHVGTALLRATRARVEARPDDWPDLTDDTDIEWWRAWLAGVWSRPDTAEAVTLASPTLARRVHDILAGKVREVKHVRRAVASAVRYVLRETGRPTPFGLFAGVAPVEFGPVVKASWGEDHRPKARVDAQWLADVVTGLEACPELLDRLTVTVNNLRSIRGGRVVLPNGPAHVEVRYTNAVRAAEQAAEAPIRFAALVDTIAAEFPAAKPQTVRSMLAELVTQRFLVTCLRSPATVPDPLRDLLDRLDEAQADDVAAVAPTVRELRAIRADLDQHNRADRGAPAQARASVVERMRGLSAAGRTPLAVDLWLDCEVTLPEQVAHEMEAAAWALLRLTGQPGGPSAWRDYYAAFVQRYGVGAMVSLRELVDPDAGLGLPAEYPGSLLDTPPAASSPRDDRLLALVYRAALDGNTEIVLDDSTIADLADEPVESAPTPPHVELSARVHAASPEALGCGEFTLTVAPARAVGTMTGRFTAVASGLAAVLGDLPTSDADAISAQLSFPPSYPHAENVTRTPRFLPHVIPLGEHRAPDEDGVIPVDDLAITADRFRLRLIWRSQQRPLEPQVFHALAMDKQAPSLARFLAALPRAHTACYTEFDWGAAARLPYLPRVRYRRSILSPARWRLDGADLPAPGTGWPAWYAALDEWRQRWRLPDTVELRDDDRVLRLDLDQPAHLAILRAQLQRAGQVVLTEAADDAASGWLGHAHEIVVPLVSTRPAVASPLARGRRPAPVDTDTYGHLPGSPKARWLFAKLYVHPDWQAEVIAAHLPGLLAQLGDDPQWWFVRYRSRHDPPHLRLRIRVDSAGEYGTCAAVVGAWAQQMRRDGPARRLVLDTYFPEVGRYGSGPVLAAAEQVFVADSSAVFTQLRHVRAAAAHPAALAAANLVEIACALCGGTEAGMAWLIDRGIGDRPAPAALDVLAQAVALADPSRDPAALRALPGGETLTAQWKRRRDALHDYRRLLPDTMDRDEVLESLLHMHQVRAMGIDRDHERVCRRLARAVALGWQARRGTR